MKISQENIDKLKDKLPLKMMSDIANETGSPYSTVRDALTVYRPGGHKRSINRKAKIYSKAIELLNARGISTDDLT